MVGRFTVVAYTFRTVSHAKVTCRSFRGNCFLLTALFISLTPFVFPLVAVAKDPPPSGEQTVREIERLNNEALQMFVKTKRQEAVALWKKADGLALTAGLACPAHVDVLLNLGQAYFKMGSKYYLLAEACLNRVVDINPDRWDTYLILGDLCYDEGLPDCAIGNYDLSLKLNPGYKHANMIRNRMEGLARYKNGLVSNVETTAAFQRKYVYSYSMDDEQQNYSFYITFNREQNLSRIDIVREGENKIHQTFKYGDFECGPSPGGVGLLIAADFNAHWNKDLKLLCMRDDGTRAGYLYYIYNRKKSMFIPFAGAMLPDSVSGPDVQEIRVFNDYGDAGQLYVESFYRVAGGKLVLMKEVKQNETAQKEGKFYYKRTITQRNQDAMAVVNESLIEAGGR